MISRNRLISCILCFVMGPALALPAAAQDRPEPPRQPITAGAPTDKEVADTQAQLIHLLRLSPMLTTVVARDPSLLADQPYVARNNPELAQFLQSHPDVARNPEFYLFSHLDEGGGDRGQALERAVWPELVQPAPYEPSPTAAVMDKIIPIIVLPLLFLAVVWIVRIFVESRRWNRTFKQQSEVHARLIDKLGTSQDLVAYMETEAGKRFLTGLPIGPGTDLVQRMPNAVARVLTPLQAGIVMTLLGIGLFFLRHAGPDMETPMTVLGTLALMPGIGFILSAGATWVLAHRLGIMPEKLDAQTQAAPFGSQDRQ
ncbi:MAG: hypothetical protein ABSF23_09555 [Terracidiphilus sp.]|jgi:hypothetical protein